MSGVDDPRRPFGAAADLVPTLAGPVDPRTGTTLTGARTFGDYRLLRVLGEGGMGTVYEAEQDNPRRRVALKVIRPGLAGPEMLRRFERESEALGRLQHPAIAQIYEAGTAVTEWGAQPFFAMEFIDGQTLLDHLDSHQLTVRQRLKLIALVAEAVHHAHQRGIIHRDLKPANILVTPAGQPKVLDFGVARMTDADSQMTRNTDVGQLVGTLAYMSPEQSLADPLELDTRSDVYSLGVIGFEMLTGTLPYKIDHQLVETVQTIREHEPTRLGAVKHAYKGDIETIVAKALEKDKTRRYASAADFAADIWRYLDDQPIIARPPSAAYQLRKLAHRHRAVVVGIAAVFVALVFGVVASTWQAARALRAERAAVVERDRAVQAEADIRRERDRAIAAEQAATLARNRAVEEQQRADTEAATAIAITDFLQGDLLAQASVAAQARPDTKADPDIRVRTLLDRAAERIDKRFDEQPLVEASVRRTIGDTYKALGLYSEASRQLTRALTLQRQTLGVDHPDVLRTMNNLGEVLWNQGRYDEARPLFLAAIGSGSRVLGDAHDVTLSAMNNLAALQWSQGQYGQAEPLFVQALAAMRRRHGDEHPDTLGTMNNLALLYRTQGKLPQAERLYSQVLATRTRVLGAEHPDTLATMNNLAALYWAEGKADDSQALFVRALGGMQRVLGDEHPETLRSTNNLATIYQNRGNTEEAEQLYAQVLATQRRVLGPQHPDTQIGMHNLAIALLDQRKFPAASTVLRDAVATAAPDSWRRYYLQSLLGSSLAGAGAHAEAEPLLIQGYLELVQRTAAIPVEQRTVVQDAARRIVQFYELSGRPAQAAEWAQKLR